MADARAGKIPAGFEGHAGAYDMRDDKEPMGDFFGSGGGGGGKDFWS